MVGLGFDELQNWLSDLRTLTKYVREIRALHAGTTGPLGHVRVGLSGCLLRRFQLSHLLEVLDLLWRQVHSAIRLLFAIRISSSEEYRAVVRFIAWTKGFGHRLVDFDAKQRGFA